jgi:crossover junction endodeoxyribonuclease RuvC
VITLGIDPGTARLGYGVILALSGLIALHSPSVLAIEQLFFARNVTTAISVGQARGVVLLAAAKAGVQVAEYSPSQVKHAVAGYGKADKAQIQEMVRMILGLDHAPHPDDAADALAIALCHAQRSAFAAVTAGGA